MDIAAMPPSEATTPAAVLDPRLAGVWIKVRCLWEGLGTYAFSATPTNNRQHVYGLSPRTPARFVVMTLKGIMSPTVILFCTGTGPTADRPRDVQCLSPRVPGSQPVANRRQQPSSTLTTTLRPFFPPSSIGHLTL